MKKTRVVAIASGKGGVGKTMVSSNLAVSLASRRKQVMLFDADLGLANAQLALGQRSAFNFSHVLSGSKSLEEITIKVDEYLRFVPGASGIQEMASLDQNTLAGVVTSFSELSDDLDYFIIDVAAGISDSVMTFLAACQERYVVVNNDPSSIADSYGIIKVMIQNHKLAQIYMIPNKVSSQEEGQLLFNRINSVVMRHLGTKIEYLYSIVKDEQVEQALRSGEPVITFAPSSAATQCFSKLSKTISDLEVKQNVSGGIQFFIERLTKIEQHRV